MLRPGGRFVFVEHVAAPAGTPLRRLQRLGPPSVGLVLRGVLVRARPGGAVRAAGFDDVDLESYRLRSPFLPFNPQIAGVATA